MRKMAGNIPYQLSYELPTVTYEKKNTDVSMENYPYRNSINSIHKMNQ